jgi:LmbE family N-acetylglucosaminyl deacetylase
MVVFVSVDMSKVVGELAQLPLEESVKLVVRKFIAPDFDRVFEVVNRVLCVAPHPDDCEFGVGGTIASLSRKGKRVYMVIATDGSLGTSDPAIAPQRLAEVRRQEQEEAASVLGVEKVMWLGYRDGYMPYDKEARTKLITLIRLLKPELVFAPDAWLPYEAHLDHRNTGLVTAEAVLFASLPHYTEENLITGLEPWHVSYIAFYYTSRPNTFYDITDTIEVKLEALKAHKSQVSSNWGYWEALLRYLAILYGKKIGVKYAEAFKLLPTSLLHAIPFTEIV